MLQPRSTIAADPVLSRLTDPERTGTRPSPLPLRQTASLRRTLLLKRSFDYVAASTLLLLTAPFILICAAIVRLTSRGPAFYTQERVGQFGRVFTIYKLRTMYHHCEHLTGPTWSVPGDPRVTPLGRVLRAAHIDELPQMINVLRGQMSLIGPRPERPEIAVQLAMSIEDYNARLAVLPGITGHAQVYLPPDVTLSDVRDKMRHDRYYMGRFSFWFDMMTAARTGLKVIGL